MATAAGGPIAAVAAGVAAEKLSDDLLAQFMSAQADQMQRLEELGQEICGRLIGLQDTVGAGLDGPWRAALTHIEEAGRRPSRREQELENARIRLIDAWGVAEALLERDPRSMDPAALRCPLIAQQIAALYGLLGEPLNAVHWLVVAYRAGRNQLDSQVDAAHDIFAQKVRRSKSSGSVYSCLHIEVWSTDPESDDPLWIYSPIRVPSRPAYGKPWRKTSTAKRDLDFEGRVVALADLDAEAQLLRRTCLDAGADETALPTESALEGARRAVIDGHGGRGSRALVVFDATLAVELEVWGAGNKSRVLVSAERSPIEKRIDDRYQEIWGQRSLFAYFPGK